MSSSSSSSSLKPSTFGGEPEKIHGGQSSGEKEYLSIGTRGGKRRRRKSTKKKSKKTKRKQTKSRR